MSVQGYQEASENLIRYQISNDTVIQIPQASVQFLLKLLAWNENPHRKHDAQDLNFILNNYLEVGNFERLYNDHEELITEQFDILTTGAELLGRDLKQICSPTTTNNITTILTTAIKEESNYNLITSMLESFEDLDTKFTQKFAQIESILSGLK